MPAKPRSAFFWGFTLVLLSAVFFSAKAVFVKLIYRAEQVDAITVLVLRMLFSLPFYILTAVVLSRREKNVKLTFSQWCWMGVMGLLGYYLSSVFDFMGLQYITAGLERLILFLYPTFALLMSAVAFHKKITRKQWLALGLAYVGMCVAFTGDIAHLGTGSNVLTGSLLILGCAITYAFYMVGSGELIPKVGAMKFTCYALMFAGLGIMLHYAVVHGPVLPEVSSQTVWLCWWIALISTVLPTFLLSAGIKMIGAGNAAIIASVGPVATILLAYLFLQEPVTWQQGCGTALVLAGVLLIGKGEGRAKKTSGRTLHPAAR